MGSSTSKAARSAGTAARQYPTRIPKATQSPIQPQSGPETPATSQTRTTPLPSQDSLASSSRTPGEYALLLMLRNTTNTHFRNQRRCLRPRPLLPPPHNRPCPSYAALLPLLPLPARSTPRRYRPTPLTTIPIPRFKSGDSYPDGAGEIPACGGRGVRYHWHEELWRANVAGCGNDTADAGVAG